MGHNETRWDNWLVSPNLLRNCGLVNVQDNTGELAQRGWIQLMVSGGSEWRGQEAELMTRHSLNQVGIHVDNYGTMSPAWCIEIWHGMWEVQWYMIVGDMITKSHSIQQSMTHCWPNSMWSPTWLVPMECCVWDSWTGKQQELVLLQLTWSNPLFCQIGSVHSSCSRLHYRCAES